MLRYFCKSLAKSRFLLALDAFFSSPFYLGGIALLTALSQIFAWEYFLWPFFVFLVFFAALFLADMRGTMILFPLGYISLSNERLDYATGINFFADSSHVLFLAALLGAVFFAFLARIIVNLIIYPYYRKWPRMALGLLLLSVTFVLGGFSTSGYGARDALFGAVEGLCLTLPYLLFFYSVDIRTLKKEYFAFLLFFFAAAVALETTVYLAKGYVEGGYTMIPHDLIHLAWGIHNNIGAMLAFGAPSAFYLFLTRKEGLIYLILSFFDYALCWVVGCRNGILFMSLAYLLCAIYFFARCRKKPFFQQGVIVFAACFLALGVFFAAKWEWVSNFFDRILSANSLDELLTGRLTEWSWAFANIQSSPWIGTGWFRCPCHYAENLTGLLSFFPARYHDIYIQLLATGGVMALAAYAYHRYETIRVVMRARNLENMFLTGVLLLLLGLSLLDNHLFNLGPGFLYSLGLFALEGNALAHPKEDFPSSPKE